MCDRASDPSQHDVPRDEATVIANRALDEAKAFINAHIDAGIAAHHLAFVYEEDERGPKGGKIFTYVCSCQEGFERKRFARHQAEMLKLP